MRFQVNPADLQEGSRMMGGSAGELVGIGGDVGQVFRGLGDAAESPDVAAAGLSAARSWGRAGDRLANEARSLARGLGGAAADYAAIEGAGVRRFQVGR